jgi:kynurenine formamidase
MESGMTGGERKSPTAEAIGALSRIRSETVRNALGLPKSGQVYDLGLELNSRIPHNPEFVRFAMSFTHTPEGTGALSPFQYSVESVFGALHIGTHIDSFIHVQKDGRIYGGRLASESRDDRGWTRHGVETVPPILGRAICLDIPGLKGLGRLPDRYEVTIDDLKQELARGGLSVQSGDIVIVRTGKIQDFGDEFAFQAAEPGVGRSAALWLYERGMSVLGTDTTGTEPLPFDDPAVTTHGAMLVEKGVHLIENLYLEDVARDGVREGLFIALPLKITGATGSWIRPILVV